MLEWIKLLETSFVFKMSTGVSILGWLISVICILYKFDPESDKKICLASDIVNSSFISIILIFSVSIAVNLTIINQASNIEELQIIDLKNKLKDYEVIISDKTEEVSQLKETIDEIRERPLKTLFEVLVELEQQDNFKLNPVVRAIHKYVDARQLDAISINAKDHRISGVNTGDGIGLSWRIEKR